jgi:hypothetical protein
VPHLGQKVLPGFKGVPQLGQPDASGIPHALQNLWPGALLAPHLGHLIHCCILSLHYVREAVYDDNVNLEFMFNSFLDYIQQY